MKKLNFIINCITLLLCFFITLKVLDFNKYDLNCDGRIDSKDLLDLKQYLLERMEYEDN
jgi:hypothetical protein